MHGRGFACAVGPEEAEDLAALHVQREVVQRRDPLAAKKAAVMLADIVKRKSWSAGHGWIKDTTGVRPKRKGLRRSEGLFVSAILLRAQEEQHEGEQNQRFNEGQSNEECELDTGASSGITGQRFSH